MACELKKETQPRPSHRAHGDPSTGLYTEIMFAPWILGSQALLEEAYGCRWVPGGPGGGLASLQRPANLHETEYCRTASPSS